MPIMNNKFFAGPDGTNRFNLVMHTADGILFMTGMTFIDFNSILPVFVQKMSGSPILVGLLPALMIIGFNVPQFIGAWMADARPLKKDTCVWLGLVMRLAWILPIIFAFFLPKWGPGPLLAAFFVAFILFVGSSGVNMPLWLTFIASTVPKNWRGRMFSARTFGSGLLGLAAAIGAKKILTSFAFPMNYAVCFLGFVVLSMMSLPFFMKIREQPGVLAKKRPNLWSYIGKTPQLLRMNPKWRNYVIARLFASILIVSIAFFAASAEARFGLDDAHTAMFALFFRVGLLLTAIIWGSLADRAGNLPVLRTGYLLAVIAAVLGAMSRSIQWMVPAMFLAGSFTAAMNVSELNVILEFCTEEERPMYVAATNILLAPIIAILPITAGYLLQHGILDYRGLFIICAVIGGIGWAMLQFAVKAGEHAVTAGPMPPAAGPRTRISPRDIP